MVQHIILASLKGLLLLSMNISPIHVSLFFFQPTKCLLDLLVKHLTQNSVPILTTNSMINCDEVVFQTQNLTKSCSSNSSCSGLLKNYAKKFLWQVTVNLALIEKANKCYKSFLCWQ